MSSVLLTKCCTLYPFIEINTVSALAAYPSTAGQTELLTLHCIARSVLLGLYFYNTLPAVLHLMYSVRGTNSISYSLLCRNARRVLLSISLY